MFETLICAIAEDKVCDSCIVSSSESSRDLLLSVTNGIHKLNPQNLSSTATAAEDKKKPESPPPLKQSTRNLSLGYTEIEKRRRALGQDLFVRFVIGMFETLICAIAEDKVCDSCIVSSSESSRDLLLSVTNRKALAPGGHSPPEPPFETLITISAMIALICNDNYNICNDSSY